MEGTGVWMAIDINALSQTSQDSITTLEVILDSAVVCMPGCRMIGEAQVHLSNTTILDRCLWVLFEQQADISGTQASSMFLMYGPVLSTGWMVALKHEKKAPELIPSQQPFARLAHLAARAFWSPLHRLQGTGITFHQQPSTATDGHMLLHTLQCFALLSP